MAQQQERPEEQSNRPLHSDKHRVPVNLTLILALVVAALGLYGIVIQGKPNAELTLIAGLAVAAYSWFTSPREYQIYQNALVIVYGRPRVKVIYFNQVSHLETLSVGFGDRLRVRLRNGRREVLHMRDPQTFRDRFQGALDDFNSEHPELAPPSESPTTGTSSVGSPPASADSERPRRQTFPLFMMLALVAAMVIMMLFFLRRTPPPS
jgi:hypothetical protein